MKKIIVLLLLLCAPAVAWAGGEPAIIETGISVEELVAAAKKVPDLEKRIEALEKRVNDLPRLTLPDDTHSWTLVPN